MKAMFTRGLSSRGISARGSVYSILSAIPLCAILSFLLCLFVPQTVNAAISYDTETYDFEAYASGSITMSSTEYPDFKVNSTVVGQVADQMTATGKDDQDISRFAFRYTGPGGSERGWYLRSNNGNNGLMCTGVNYTPDLAILNLRAGDVVTITFSNASINYTGGVNVLKGTAYGNGIYSAEEKALTSGQSVTILQDGDLKIAATGMTYIQKIVIKTIRDAEYRISDTETTDGVPEHAFSFTKDGRMKENAVVVPFMKVEFGNSLNVPIVNDSKVSIPDQSGYEFLWPQDGKPYQGTFYVFKPTASGKLWIKGNQSNAQMQLLEYNADGTYQATTWTGTTSGDVEIGWVQVKKNNVYYLVEGKEQMESGTSRAYTVFRLEQFKFQNTFSIGSLGVVLENGATGGELATVKNAGSLNSWQVRDKWDNNGKKVSENIDTSSLSVTCSESGELSISGIAYKDDSKDKAGVIVLDLDFENGDAIFVVTIPYSASFDNGKGHRWDFYANELEIGKYSDTNSQLRAETDNEEWKFTYRVINNQGVGTHDPMYQNVYDMEGDNADMIWETEGLWFDTGSYQSCLYNENPVNTAVYTDRYVGILPGGSFTIPGLKKGDRVIIMMGSGDGSNQDVCFLNITNALDAIGTSIDPNDVYKAGGTLWNTSEDVPQLRGYYHFTAAADGNMTFRQNGGSMTKIYSIEIYSGKHRFSDDAARYSSLTYNSKTYNANSYQYFNNYKSASGAKGCYRLHYRGKGDPLKQPTVVYKSGTVTTTSDKLFYAMVGTDHFIFFESTPGEFGMFRIRIETVEQSGKYVADYGLQSISVGYLGKQTYPYTWDFRDLMKYAYTDSDNRIKQERTTVAAYNEETEFMDYTVDGTKAIDQWMWYANDDMGSKGYGLNTRNGSVGSGEISFTHSQLYAGNEFLAETVGLDIQPQGSEPKRNGRLRITDEGLSLYEQSGNYWRIMIPEVPADAAVYFRVKDLKTSTTTRAAAVKVGNASTDLTYSAKTSDGESVYAVNGTGGDMTFYISNAVLQRIAVSTDPKKVNVKGWTTESRDHVIDPELTAYMTGVDFETCLVTGVDYDNKTVTLQRSYPKATNDKVMRAMTDGSKGASIIHNTANEAVSILNGGFHLFVPDMHDFGAEGALKSVTHSDSESKPNMLIAQVSNSNGAKVIPSTSGDYTNYALTYQYYKLDADGNKYGAKIDGDEAFYRIATGGASSTGNQAYLPLLTEKVKPSTTAAPAQIFKMLFVDEEMTETTAISEITTDEESATAAKEAWYNLNGQKLDGRPTTAGLYVVNGKKVIIK